MFMCNLDKFHTSKIRNRSTADRRKPVTTVMKRSDEGKQRCRWAKSRICLTKKSGDRMKYEKRDSVAEKLTLTFRHTLSSSETVIIIYAQETALIRLTRSKSCYNTKKTSEKLFFEISCAIRVRAIKCLALRFVLSGEMIILIKDKQYVFLQMWLQRKWNQTLKKSVTYREKPVPKKLGSVKVVYFFVFSASLEFFFI
jgi:6-phosphogluconate dehydrogenase